MILGFLFEVLDPGLCLDLSNAPEEFVLKLIKSIGYQHTFPKNMFS